MATLFNRVAIVVVELKPPGENEPFDSFIIRDLRIQFKIEKTILSTPNVISISIWNLSKATRDRMQQEGDNVILEVGYAGLPGRPGFTEIIGVGDLTFVDSTKQGPDWVTTLECKDGGTAKKYAQINENLPPGSDLIDAAKKAAEKIIDLVTGDDSPSIAFSILEAIRTATSNAEVPGAEDEGIIQQGVTLVGNAGDVLTDLMDKVGGEWSVQDGNVQITEVAADNGQPFVLISPTTGLIGSPTTAENKIITFKTLMLPKIRAGRRIRMRSNEINGDYKVLNVSFEGDTYGPAWNANVEAKLLNVTP